MLKIITLLSLYNQGQHESVSRYRGVWLSFPPIFFELLLSLAIFWLGAGYLCQQVSTTLSGIRRCSHRALLLLVLFDIATVRLRLNENTNKKILPYGHHGRISHSAFIAIFNAWVYYTESPWTRDRALALTSLRSHRTFLDSLPSECS